MNYRLKYYFFIAQKITKGKTKLLNIATIVALLSIILGNIALLLSLAVLDGFDIKLHDIAVKFTSHISARSFNKSPLENHKEVKQKLLVKFNENNNNKKKLIGNISNVIEKEALIRAKDYIDGVLVRGVEDYNAIKKLQPYFIQGTYKFSAINAREILVSKRLADKMNIKIGDKVILYSILKSDGKIPKSKILQFKLKGIYSTGFASWDDLLVIIPLQVAQNLFNMKGAVTTLEITLNTNETNQINNSEKQKEISDLAITMENYIGYPYFFQTVYDFHRAIFNWISLQKEPIPLVLGLISLVAALNIITALIIAVVEKTHSIGILRTMGMSKKDIRIVFSIRGLVIGLIGSFIGCFLSFIILLLQFKFEFFKLNAGVHFLETVPVSINYKYFLFVFVFSIFLSVLASLVPSVIATRISPLKAIKFK